MAIPVDAPDWWAYVDYIRLIETINTIGVIAAINNILNVESVDLIDRIALIDRITLIDDITNVGTINLINTITTVAAITNILNVDSVDLIDRITLLDTITNVGTVNLINTIAAITNIANIDSVDLIDEITLIDTITTIGTISQIRDVMLTLPSFIVNPGSEQGNTGWFTISTLPDVDDTKKASGTSSWKFPANEARQMHQVFPIPLGVDWIEKLVCSIRATVAAVNCLSVTCLYTDGTSSSDDLQATAAYTWEKKTLTPTAGKKIERLIFNHPAAYAMDTWLDEIFTIV